VLLQRIADLRPGEGPRVLFAALWCGCLLTANSGLHPLRDAMGVAGGVDKLQWLFTATFLVMLAAVPLFGLAVAKLGRARLVPWVHRVLAGCALVFFALMQGWFGESPAIELWTARVFFVWTSVFNLFAVSLFWSVMADLFEAGDAKRLFGLISVGGSIGALLGPFLGGVLALWADPSLLLLLVALALELSLVCLRALHAAHPSIDVPPPNEAIGGSPFAGIAELLRSPALLSICAYVLLMTISSTVVYFVQARIVEREFSDPDERTAVFAGIDFAVNALTLIVQGLLAGRCIRRFGLGITLAVLPVLTLVGLLALALAPVLATLVAMQVVRRAGQYGLAKPAREVLFTKVDRSERYKAKSLIDTVVYRGGDALTGWAFAGLAALGLGLGGIALVFAPLAAGWIAVALWLGRERGQ
jgi:AAA family ATP:ADP antiporter